MFDATRSRPSKEKSDEEKFTLQIIVRLKEDLRAAERMKEDATYAILVELQSSGSLKIVDQGSGQPIDISNVNPAGIDMEKAIGQASVNHPDIKKIAELVKMAHLQADKEKPYKPEIVFDWNSSDPWKPIVAIRWQIDSSLAAKNEYWKARLDQVTRQATIIEDMVKNNLHKLSDKWDSTYAAWIRAIDREKATLAIFEGMRDRYDPPTPKVSEEQYREAPTPTASVEQYNEAYLNWLDAKKQLYLTETIFKQTDKIFREYITRLKIDVKEPTAAAPEAIRVPPSAPALPSRAKIEEDRINEIKEIKRIIGVRRQRLKRRHRYLCLTFPAK
jgi:hypothetical protein